jgi:hypothetical protein
MTKKTKSSIFEHPSSDETYQKMLNPEPGDVFHEMFTFVIRVRSVLYNKIIITEHYGTGPIKEKRFFNSADNFAHHYSYKSKIMKNKSFLSWAPTGFKYADNAAVECICEPIDLLTYGCQCV